MSKQSRSVTSSLRLFPEAKHLGDFVIEPDRFFELESALEELQTSGFKKLNERQKSERINRLLLELIQKASEPAFLLITVVDYIERINREKIIDHYTFSNFELWLNQFSGLTLDENYQIRAKIVGKWVPRDEYQILFPIGMGKTYPGSHFVTAHSSPDLDTTIASFWGWVDAFAARVGEGLHIWNVPGGAPPSSIEIGLLFEHIFGQNVFNSLAKTRTSLAISGLDLVTQKNLLKKQTDQSTLQIDHERTQKAVVLVDDHGYFLGDWRNYDVEGVRQVTLLLNNCLRWFENNLHVKLISFFAKENPSLKDLPQFINSVFGIKIRDCDPVKYFTDKQQRYVQDYLVKVLKVGKGLDSSFEEFAHAMKNLSIFDYQECFDLIESLSKSKLFDPSGYLVEDRPKIFHYLEKIIMALDKANQSVRSFTERLEVALKIKTQVFGYTPQVVSYRADVDEIKSKMGTYSYLTVTTSDKEGGLIPLGIVHSSDLHKSILGTVSLRDFCNREETKIPSYLEVISVIDHHKSTLNTFSAPMAYISDAQSSNTLVAELAFKINDKYSTLGMSLAEIESQIQEVQKDLSNPSNNRILRRLLQHRLASIAQNEHTYFIHPIREFVEYLHFLYGILDDTDLLTKVSRRDLECVASLLNRLKSLLLGKEVEIISFDGLNRAQTFIEGAARRILQHPDMYSLYRKIYIAKEQLVEENFQLCAKGQPSSIFVDTKEQNGCCRVGQTKMFCNNYPIFKKLAPAIRKVWFEEAKRFYEDQKGFDLHLHMTSTISGAEDLFSGTQGKCDYKDELWIWIPSTEQAIEHLKSFLNSFRSSPQMVNNDLEVEFLGDNAEELAQIFAESFLPIPQHISPRKKGEALPLAILKYRAGSINSRKAMISPYLPKTIT